MNTRDFDRLVESIRTEAVPEEAVREACERVRERIESELGEAVAAGRLASCADFRSLFSAYRKGSLSEARRMLVEDHLHSCVTCRKAFQGSGRVVTIPNVTNRSLGRRVVPWAMAAAAVVVLGIALRPAIQSGLDRMMAPAGARATIASVQGELYRVTDGGLSLISAGALVAENEQIRTSKGSRAVVRLRDGSTVEMAERSDLRISERWSGKTVRLERGSVMVEAAKQTARTPGSGDRGLPGFGERHDFRGEPRYQGIAGVGGGRRSESGSRWRDGSAASRRSDGDERQHGEYFGSRGRFLECEFGEIPGAAGRIVGDPEED